MKEADRQSRLEGHPDRPLLYSSPLILERRTRLLREVRRMIAESGLEGFSVRKLCERAEVAQRTLYNAFHSKDRVIAIAIREAYDDVQYKLRHQTDPVSLEGVLDRTIAINRRNFPVRNYTKAITSIYFGPTTPRDVWETLREMSVGAFYPWLLMLAEKGELQPWTPPQHLATAMANLQYAVIQDWCMGRITDDEYLPRLTEAMLLLIIGSVRGGTRDAAEKYLSTLKETGKVPEFPHPTLARPRTNGIANDEQPRSPRPDEDVGLPLSAAVKRVAK